MNLMHKTLLAAAMCALLPAAALATVSALAGLPVAAALVRAQDAVPSSSR